ncbi:MAG: DUF4160 domain-containing protein [Proteiniphilum sp.]
MPEVLRKMGYTFYFFSNDHLPIHIHVRKGNGEAKFEFKENGEIELKRSINMKVAEFKMAQSLAEAYQDEIIDEWIKYFNE